MVSMLASTYQMDEEDTLPYLRMYTHAEHLLHNLTCEAKDERAPAGNDIMPDHPVFQAAHVYWGAMWACKARHAPPQRRAAGLHQARRQPQLLLHGVQHTAPARVHAEVLKRAPSPSSMLNTFSFIKTQRGMRLHAAVLSLLCPIASKPVHRNMLIEAPMLEPQASTQCQSKLQPCRS